MKLAITLSSAIRNGGSFRAGASALSAGTFKKSGTIRTNALRESAVEAHCDQADHLLFVQGFAGQVVFGHFTRANFLSFAFSGFLNPRHHPSLERVPFFKQLINTFRIRTFDVVQTLQVSGLFARARFRSLAGERR